MRTADEDADPNFAGRIRFHKMKLVWDPQYVSAKKKIPAERDARRTELAEPKKQKKSKPLSSPSISTSQPTATELPLHPNLFEECDEAEFERLDDERYAADELYEPVEAYAGNIQMPRPLRIS
eukprot:s1049_g19.t1